MMLKYESTIGKADVKGKSSRVIIPKEIIKMLDLEWGDKLVWNADISDKGVTVTVTPLKKVKKEWMFMDPENDVICWLNLEERIDLFKIAKNNLGIYGLKSEYINDKEVINLLKTKYKEVSGYDFEQKLLNKE